MKHKLLFFIFILCILTSLLAIAPVTASATTGEVYTTWDDAFTYRIIGRGQAAIVKINNTEACWDVTIPETLEWGSYTVVEIDAYAFQDCYDITGITIPDSVTAIGEFAFAGCESLMEITIGNSVETIGNSAFYGCWNLTEVNIPDSVTTIGEYAFAECGNLTDVTVGKGVAVIGNGAFDGSIYVANVYVSDIAAWCKIDFETEYSYRTNPLYDANLYLNGSLVTDLVIPNGVTEIGDWAFLRCKSLTSVTIPDSVVTIGWAAFSECYRITDVTIGSGTALIRDWAFVTAGDLTDITVSQNNQMYSSVDGHLFDKHQTKLIQYATGNKNSSYAIPDGVTTIGRDAFQYGYYLTDLYIPDSVTFIDAGAFTRYLALTDVYYSGTSEDWKKISINYDNATLTDANIHYRCTITYYANGGYGKPEAQSAFGEAELSQIIPKKLGYTFLGWATSQDSVKVEYKPGDIVTLTNDLDLYAIWEKTSYVTINKLPVSGMTLIQVNTTGIPADSQIVLACYNGNQLVYPEPVTKVAGEDTYYFIPTGDYTTSKVMVLDGFDDFSPVIAATPVQ